MKRGVWRVEPSERCLYCYRQHEKTGGTRWTYRPRAFCSERCRIAYWANKGNEPSPRILRLRELEVEVVRLRDEIARMRKSNLETPNIWAGRALP